MSIKEKIYRQFSPYKVLASWDRVEKIFEGKNPPPITAELHPADSCNFQCGHCYNQKERKKRAEFQQRMKDDLLFDAINTLIKGGVRGVVLGGGGEPLIHKQVKEAVERLNNSNIRVGLITNGVGLDEKISSILSQSKGFIRVSLDAYNEKSHDDIHKPRDKKCHFNSILNNLKILVKLRKEKQNNSLIIGIGYVVVPPTNNDYEKIRCLCESLKEIGIDYLQMRPQYKEGQPLSEKEENSKWVSDKTESLAQEFNDEHFTVVKTEARKGARKYNGKKRYNKCFAAHLMPLLGADGTLYVCCQLQNKKQFSFCCIEENISAGDILKVWESSKRINTINNIDVHKCPDCRFDELNEFLYGVYIDPKKRESIKNILDYLKYNPTTKESDKVNNRYSQTSKDKKLNWDVDKIKLYLSSIKFTDDEKDWEDNISPFLL